MQISARNKFVGTIKDIKLGQVTAEIVVEVGSNQIVSVITKDSAEEMKLKKGDQVTAIIKSTSVMIMK